MKLANLQRCHPEHRGDVLRTYRDLFVGGEQFLRNVARYMPRNDLEPPKLYQQRCERAHYVNYAAPIAGYFAAWLFTCPLEVTFDPAETSAGWWPDWKEDCDGTGTDFDDFLRGRFLEALVCRRAWWRVEPADADDAAAAALAAPSAALADWERAGLGAARVCAVPTEHVTHWRRDPDSDALVWALEHDRREELLELGDDACTITETWTQWRADGAHRRWQLVYQDGGKRPDADTEVPEVAPPADKTGGIPLVELRLPRHLWLLDLVAGPQIENFRARNALAWAIYRTCYAMPVFKLADRKRPPAMGAGYYLMLGVDESVDWPAPPSTPFQVIGDYATQVKDEIYRVTHQMAVGVDQGQAAAVARSGDSKDADNRATEVVLGAFGAPVREAAERTADLLLRARGDATTRASARGMDRYHVTDAGAVLEQAAAAQVLDIPSRTHRVELLTRAALASAPDLDEAKKAKVVAEIEKNTPDPAAKPAAPALAGMPPGMPGVTPPHLAPFAHAAATAGGETQPGEPDDDDAADGADAPAPREVPPRRHRLPNG